MNRPICLVLALGALALPAAATAAPVPTIDYRVTIEGSADYNRADVDGEASAQHDIALDFKTVVPKVTFYDDVVEDSHGALGTATIRRGAYVLRGGNVQTGCTGHTLSDSTGGGFDATHNADRTVFATRVIDAFDVLVSNCGGGMPAWTLPFGSGGDEVGVGIFDGTFTMPDSRIGEASMTFPLEGEVTGSSCPFNHFNTVMCVMTWSATVTFTRIGEGEVDLEDDLHVPIVPGPAPAPPKPQLDDDLLVPIVPNPAVENGLKLAKAAMSRDLSSAGLPVTCVKKCSGTVTATAKGKTLASRTFKADAGDRTTVRLRFDAADRRAIRKAGGVKLSLRAKVGGRSVRHAVTVKPARRG